MNYFVQPREPGSDKTGLHPVASNCKAKGPSWGRSGNSGRKLPLPALLPDTQPISASRQSGRRTNQYVFSGGARRLADAYAPRLLRDGPWAAEAVAAARAGAALARPLAARPTSCGCGADPEAAAAVPGWRHVIVPRRAAGLCAAAAAAAAEGDGASAEPGQVSSRLLPARCRPAWGRAACPCFAASAAPPPSAGRGPPGLARPLARRPLYSRQAARGPHGCGTGAATARPGQACRAGGGDHGGRTRSEGSAGVAREGPDPPGCHGHRAPTPPAPARPLGPLLRPGCSPQPLGRPARLEQPGWACACRDSVAGVRGPPAVPRVAATSGSRAPLGARGWPPRPHPTPTNFPTRARSTRLLSRTPELPTLERTPERRGGQPGVLGLGEEPGSSFPSEKKRVCFPPSGSLSLGHGEPTYLEEKAGGRDRIQMFEMKI
ncbi:collagen alpha-1(I) chain [Rattus norvegicus]|uniref:collagen alpha-1(I) chain n=1 Tax=Rattus norvegicus TaxID=10116 RepID=UPI002FD7E90E